MFVRYQIIFGALVTAAVGGYFGVPLFSNRYDRTALLPGQTSHGHYSIESKCEACHTPFRGVSNDACNRCHGADLHAAQDAHPERTFTDPRNADRVAGLNARACVTCHREHVPGRTLEGGVTLPRDFCFSCHQDIARERPSHQGFAFEGCASTGCHRFHDNRGIYEGFLSQHLHEPDILPVPAVPHTPLEARAGQRPLTAQEQDAPGGATIESTVREWAASAHAQAGVNCSGCHTIQDSATGMIEWKDRPGRAACAGCHSNEESGFLKGKHGMRLDVGLPPMTPSLAHLPMRPESQERALGCTTCHSPHSSDARQAAVEGCLSCHDDKHSRAYMASRHYQLWQRELRGEGAPGTGVSCATCHLPREVFRTHGKDTVRVEHNQNKNLRPNDKMLRSVCLNCHGLGFSIDALADAELPERNFNGRPSVHIGSLDMAERRLAGGGGTKGKRP